jgi:acyl carrier protein
MRVKLPGALNYTLLRIMTIGSATPLQRATDLRKCLSVSDICSLVAKRLNVDVDFITSEAHFTNDLGAVELMLAVEDQFAGVEITDDDIEQIQLVGDLVRHLNAKAGQ